MKRVRLQSPADLDYFQALVENFSGNHGKMANDE